MSDTTYILKVPAVGEITREEFRADDDMQLEKAVGSKTIITQSSPSFPLDIACWERRDRGLKLVFKNRRVSEILQRSIYGRVVFSGLDEKFKIIGLTAEQCDELERQLTTRRREPEQEAESRNGEAEAVRNAVGCESVP